MSVEADTEGVHGHWGALAELIRPFRAKVIGLAMVTAAATSLALAGPLILRAFIDRAIAGSGTTVLLTLAAVYVAVALVAQIVGVVVLWAATKLAWRVTDSARVDLTDHLLRHDMEFQLKHTPGELVERVDGDLTAVSEHLAGFAITALSVTFTLMGMLVVVTVIDWRIGLILALYSAFAAMAFVAVRDRAVADAAIERGALARLFGGIEERLVGVDDLRANNGGTHAMARFEADAEQVLEASVSRERAIVWLWHGATGAVAGGLVVALIIGAAGTSLGWISVGTAFLLFQYMQLLQRPLDQVVEQLQEVQKAAGGILRVRTLLADEPSEPPAVGPPLPTAAMDVRFEAVWFSYGDEPVLQDLDLVIPAGASMGLVGATGGGKTTLGRLLTRTLAADQGLITLGSVALEAAGEADLRRAVGVVPQEVQVFNSSIRNNVTLFDPSIDDEAVIDALEQVNLASSLLSTPGPIGSAALDRELGGETGNLSAGEAQLLALSRVFLRNPSVVVLDEATSRVDPETEQLVLEAIESLLAGRTSLVIAHRMATLERVDQIAVLAGGAITEVGRRVDLLSDNSTYARLVALTTEVEPA